jgi:hypothetical protein
MPSEITAGARSAEARGTESVVDTDVGPDYGPGMNNRANCSGTGLHKTSGVDGAASVGDGARTASGARAHGAGGRTMPEMSTASTGSDKDPVWSCTSKVTTGNKVIAEA